jgi:hypothetical protein
MTLEANAALRSIVRHNTGERRVSEAAGEVKRHRHAHAGAVGEAGSQASSVPRKVPTTTGRIRTTPTRASSEEEWAHASGSQGRAPRWTWRPEPLLLSRLHRADVGDTEMFSETVAETRRAYYKCGGRCPRRCNRQAGSAPMGRAKSSPTRGITAVRC